MLLILRRRDGLRRRGAIYCAGGGAMKKVLSREA